MNQRSRWARGMVEGIRTNPPQKQPRVLTKFVAGIDYLVPLLDIGYVFFWVPGAILFAFGYPLIVSWWSMLVIPITLLIYGLLRRWQERWVFSRLGIDVEPDRRGFLCYLFGYQALTSAAALRGYAQPSPEPLGAGADALVDRFLFDGRLVVSERHHRPPSLPVR